MAIIHQTEMAPTKLELLAGWLPSRPWWQGEAEDPQLEKAGGFRLDDPAGEVGLEFMAVADGPTAYLVPMSYRGTPLDGADDALIGTSEHGILGRRWIYDGIHDPVLVAQLAVLLRGEALPQHQSASDTPDLTVEVHPARQPLSPEDFTVLDHLETTELILGTTTIDVSRLLRPAPPAATGQVLAPWTLTDGTLQRGPFFTVRSEASER